MEDCVFCRIVNGGARGPGYGLRFSKDELDWVAERMRTLMQSR
jgi:hypothetical protein